MFLRTKNKRIGKKVRKVSGKLATQMFSAFPPVIEDVLPNDRPLQQMFCKKVFPLADLRRASKNFNAQFLCHFQTFVCGVDQLYLLDSSPWLF